MIALRCKLSILYKLSENEARGLDAGEKTTAQAIAKALLLFPGKEWDFEDLEWVDSDQVEITLIKKPYLDPERQ